MIYELRVYRVVQGRMAALLSRPQPGEMSPHKRAQVHRFTLTGCHHVGHWPERAFGEIITPCFPQSGLPGPVTDRCPGNTFVNPSPLYAGDRQ